jgi:hypothetical protein
MANKVNRINLNQKCLRVFQSFCIMNRDVDSDGEEIIFMDDDNKPQQFTFWFALDIKVDPTDPQAVIEIETACFVSI